VKESRPVISLRLRDTAQLLDVKYLAEAEKISVNKWILLQLERIPLLAGAKLSAQMEARARASK
jgi:hypothetical protein